MRQPASAIAGVITAIIIAAPAAAQQDRARGIAGAVERCVATVREQGDKSFDAFYNPATKKVENNAYYVLERPALFRFNKCMATQGFPLAYPQP